MAAAVHHRRAAHAARVPVLNGPAPGVARRCRLDGPPHGTRRRRRRAAARDVPSSMEWLTCPSPHPSHPPSRSCWASLSTSCCAWALPRPSSSGAAGASTAALHARWQAAAPTWTSSCLWAPLPPTSTHSWPSWGSGCRCGRGRVRPAARWGRRRVGRRQARRQAQFAGHSLTSPLSPAAAGARPARRRRHGHGQRLFRDGRHAHHAGPVWKVPGVGGESACCACCACRCGPVSGPPRLLSPAPPIAAPLLCRPRGARARRSGGCASWPRRPRCCWKWMPAARSWRSVRFPPPCCTAATCSRCCQGHACPLTAWWLTGGRTWMNRC